MKYVLLIHHAEAYLSQTPPEEQERITESHRQLQANGKDDGSYLGAVRLAPTGTAVSIRRKGGSSVVVDGPFTETKEQLVGFYVFESESRDSVKERAAQIKMFPTGTVEVRPILWSHPGMSLSGDGQTE